MSEFLFAPFFIKAIIAAIGVAFATAPIGVFVLWKKMAYFGDAISHSAIFGLGIATIIAVEPIYGIIFCALVFSLVIFLLNQQNLYAIDSIIGITSCTLLALGMILLAIFPTQIDLEEYLFGDLVKLSNANILMIYAIAAVAILAMSLWFKKLLLATINSDLATISGIAVKKLQLKFLLLTALVVACLVKIVGIFLITSLMILPAAIARNFSKTPTQMLFLALLFSILVMVGGLLIALFFNLPSSPAIIAFAACLLMSSIIGSKIIYAQSN
ncbi:MAG: metal ABC transporter permease [Pseudomonadota bacterium]